MTSSIIICDGVALGHVRARLTRRDEQLKAKAASTFPFLDHRIAAVRTVDRINFHDLPVLFERLARIYAGGNDVLLLLHLRRLGNPPENLGRMDLPDLDAALAEAWRVALELRDELPARDPFNGLAVEIAEETGRMVLTIPISEAEAA